MGNSGISSIALALCAGRSHTILCIVLAGINLLVIVFLYLALDIDSLKILKYLLGVASVLHVLSFGLVRCISFFFQKKLSSYMGICLFSTLTIRNYGHNLQCRYAGAVI